MRKSFLWVSLILFSVSVIAFFYILSLIRASMHMESLTDFFVIIVSLSVYSVYFLIFVGIPLIASVIFLILAFVIPESSESHEKKVFMAECRKGNDESECKDMWELRKM